MMIPFIPMARSRNASMTDAQKELESQQRSASAIARIASMTDEQRDQKRQQRSASAIAGHVTRNAGMTR